MIHTLKCQAKNFDATASGHKPFELRRDDRTPPFKVGDMLLLMRYNGEVDTKKRMLVSVTYVYRGEHCKPGYCAMAITPEPPQGVEKSISCAGCRHERAYTLACYDCRRNPRRLAQYDDLYTRQED